MSEKTYNGWTNYETWCAALWLDNERASYEGCRQLARDCWEEAPTTRRGREWGRSRQDVACELLADRLKDELEEGNPLKAPSLFSDLLGAAMSEIDWREIAGHYVAEAAGQAAVEPVREKTT